MDRQTHKHRGPGKRAARRQRGKLGGITVNLGWKLVDLTWADGRPLVAGEIEEGQTVSFDRETGEVLSIT